MRTQLHSPCRAFGAGAARGRPPRAPRAASRRPHKRIRPAQRPAAKMAVPHNTFDGLSPEQRAAASLTTLFTFVALR